MTVDSRLDDLETFRRNANQRLQNLADADTAINARLDQLQAQLTTITQAQTTLMTAITQLQTAHQQLLSGCLALQGAMNEFRLQVHRTFRGEGTGF